MPGSSGPPWSGSEGEGEEEERVRLRKRRSAGRPPRPPLPPPPPGPVGSVDRGGSHGRLLEKIFTEIDGLRVGVGGLTKARGTKDSPARTCRDIHLEFPSLPDGWFWIDPNLGIALDAINVWCNMTAMGETCVYPDTKSRLVLTQSWSKDPKNPNQLFSKFPGGQKISYTDEVQLNFLRLLHREAHQTFIYFCRNAVAWFDAVARSHDGAVTLVGPNGHETSTADLGQRDIEMDGCSSRPSNGLTVFRLKSTKLQQLPIVDFRPKDYGAEGQQFGFESGPICFR